MEPNYNNVKKKTIIFECLKDALFEYIEECCKFIQQFYY